jgi:hypothetical protein
VPLSDRIAARQQSESGEADAPAVELTSDDYEAQANTLADRVSRLSRYRGRADRARVIHQLTEIDGLVHALLTRVSGKSGT